MGQYRDDLDAAHARIAALEAEVKALETKKSAPGKKGRKGHAEDPVQHAQKQVESFNTAAESVRELAGHLDGSRIPSRSRRGGWVTLAAVFALHGALAWWVVPGTMYGQVGFVASWMVPLTLAAWIYRQGRVLADPGTPLVEKTVHGPTFVYRTRKAAAAILAALVALDVAWALFGLPAMVQTTTPSYLRAPAGGAR